MLVVGSMNMDLVVHVARLPAPGATVIGGDLTRGAGGKGANQAVAARRLGAAVRLVAATGDDEHGEQLVAGAAAEDVDVSLVTALPDVPTGAALIVVQPDGQNTVTVSPGANGRLLPAALPRDPDLLAGSDVVVLQMEIPLATNLHVARAARAAGVPVVLNAAPLADPIDETVTELICTVDVLVVNESEALGLIGRPDDDGPSAPQDWTDLARHLTATGPSTVVITLGGQGAVVHHAGEAGWTPAFRVDVVDAVGAGDTFCAELAVSLAEQRPAREAVRRACAAGALATRAVGAQTAMPSAREVEELLARLPERVAGSLAPRR